MLPDELLRIRSLRRGDTVLLRLTGELDMATAPLVDSAAVSVPLSDARCLHLDLANVTFCDEAGLRALRRISDLAQASHVALCLVGIHPNVRRTVAWLGSASPWLPPMALS
ncbi:STAS domain-containing protein [Streptomyces sp. NBC_01077]|uniref:STAS domain-containing protein n=1 Tax=Streptomyces sp. NBC_01077 TaxID=2903746 RepID=UPI00386CE527